MGHRSPQERAQESALEARLDKKGEMGTRQKYLKLDKEDAENMNEIGLTKSGTNHNEFTHSELRGMTPDKQVYRSMKGHYKFVDGDIRGGHVAAFRFAELHINRIPSLGLGRSGPGSWLSGLMHAAVDGETHFAPLTYTLEMARNLAVDIGETGYYARNYYVY